MCCGHDKKNHDIVCRQFDCYDDTPVCWECLAEDRDGTSAYHKYGPIAKAA